MQVSIVARNVVTAFATCAAVAAVSASAFALEITVNGQMATFDPPPIEKAGRVFVPLRGVFERLGASVVYSGGVINAQGNGKSISLKIGSTTATVNGAAQTLDVAPFIVGASTYVPLRFVSESLGAGVNFDAGNQVVALTTGAAVAAGPTATPSAAPRILNDHQPSVNGTVLTSRPTISANFLQPVDPQSFQILLDGRDVSSVATVSSSGFIYSPPSPLQSIPHTVTVNGKLANGGTPFTNTWSFTSGHQALLNSLVITSPGEGATVGQTFTITGHTVPNAHVHIVAGATATVGGVFAFGAGSYVSDLTADSSGSFSQAATLQTVSGAQIGVTVTSTDPISKGAAEKKLRLIAQ